LGNGITCLALLSTDVRYGSVRDDPPCQQSWQLSPKAAIAASFYIPKSTSAEIVDKLNTEIDASLADHEMKARVGEMAGM